MVKHAFQIIPNYFIKAAAEGDNKQDLRSKEMSLLTAALMGDPTGLTAALHGYKHGGKDQALRSGIASSSGGIGGGIIGLLLSTLTKNKIKKGVGSTAGALLGGSGGSVYAANEFNKRLRDQQVKSASEAQLNAAGVSGYNKAKRTPSHPTKSHVVVAKEGGKTKLIRFGEQGAETAGKPKKGESQRMKMKRKSFKARHGKNIAKGKMSAAYWANKAKW